MSTANDLCDRAEHLRQALPPRRASTPPAENGERLATIERSESEEIRINWSEYEGKPYLAIRLWTQGHNAGWWPSKKGISIRVRELPDLAEGIAAALGRVEESLARWREQADRPRPPMLGRRMNPEELPPASSRGFDEFQGGPTR